MKVLVIGMNGLGLMPTTPRKARILLKEKKAIVVRKVPFTIKLLYKTGCATQAKGLGVDTGSQHIGVGVITEKKVLTKAEHTLRSTMEKRSLLETRKEYRRGRRYRKTRYRKPKFKAHTKRYYSEKPVKRNGHLTHWIKKTISYESNRPKGWLPPSIESKVQHHIRIIHHYEDATPPDKDLNIEIARMDVARMKDPNIHGEMYQKGPLYDQENIKAYILQRDNYKCKVCKAKAGTKRKDDSIVKLKIHHIDFKSEGATDNPDRMCCVCDKCHTLEAHKPGGILYDWMVKGKKFARGYRDATFMNILNKRLREEFPYANFTYGNITAADRKNMGLPKSHANDAVAIASHGEPLIDEEETVYYQQVRHNKRSLHEANPRKGRKEPNTEAKRNKKNTKSVTITVKDKDSNKKEKTFHIYDKVSFNGQAGWISGFTGQSAYVKDENNEYLTYKDKNYKQINLSDLIIISHNNNWLIGAKKQI